MFAILLVVQPHATLAQDYCMRKPVPEFQSFPPIGCPSHKPEKVGGFCYPVCPSGYNPRKSDKLWCDKPCDGGFTNTGVSCYRAWPPATRTLYSKWRGKDAVKQGPVCNSVDNCPEVAAGLQCRRECPSSHWTKDPVPGQLFLRRCPPSSPKTCGVFCGKSSISTSDCALFTSAVSVSAVVAAVAAGVCALSGTLLRCIEALASPVLTSGVLADKVDTKNYCPSP